MKAQFWDGKFLEQTINNLSWFIVRVKYPWWCCWNVTHLTPWAVLRLIFVVLIEVFVTLFVVRSPSHVPIIDIKCPMAADPDWTRAPAQYWIPIIIWISLWGLATKCHNVNVKAATTNCQNKFDFTPFALNSLFSRYVLSCKHNSIPYSHPIKERG